MSDDRLERALGDAIADLAGTGAPDYLNDILERTSRTRQRPWWTFPARYTIMTTTLRFAATAGLAFVLGLGVAPLITSSGEGGGVGPAALPASEQSDDAAFPTGTFVSVENSNKWMEFHEDGSGRTRNAVEGTDVGFTYASRGNLWTQMTHDEPVARQVPATYFWDFDGEILTFELWGEDLNAWRRADLEKHRAWTLVRDPRVVVVAARDIPAGDAIHANSGVVRVLPATEAGPGAFADRRDVSGHIATVDISAGQPLTLEVMEPSVE